MKPIAFLVFNRPNQTARVLARLRDVRPERLLVVADGPRTNHPDDLENCREVRELIERAVDWPCEVSTNFAPENLGCGRRISSGLTWVFEQVEEAIIVEDDCLPDSTFFSFCEELLDRFRSDERVMMISGNNFQFGRNKPDYSYYFSRYPHIWGWATWRRAWQHYDFNMLAWPEIRDQGLLAAMLPEGPALARWHQIFDLMFEHGIDTWDHQWTFACWRNNGLAILPAHNLVSNIGFDGMGTHTRATGAMAEMATIPMSFPLRHPTYVIRNVEADAFTESLSARIPLSIRAWRKAQRLWSVANRKLHGWRPPPNACAGV